LSGPIPARVDSAAKTLLLDLIDDAVKAGWTLARICGVLELDRQRAWRWRHRQAAGTLDDAPPGGNPVHGLLAWEEAEIRGEAHHGHPRPVGVEVGEGEAAQARVLQAPAVLPPSSGQVARATLAVETLALGSRLLQLTRTIVE